MSIPKSFFNIYSGEVISKCLVLILLSISCPLLISVNAQSIRTEYGKNRVQYHDDFNKWWMYETENFLVYWYGKGRNIAQAAIQTAEQVNPEIQNIVEHRINDKIEIIIYTDLSDLLQSNIGLEETFETTHELTKVIGSRIFIYFDGNHRHLARKIREGIARVYFNSMYSRGGLQEVVVSDPDLKVPSWYQEGFYSYSKSHWDFLIEDELRDLWYHKPKTYRDFDKLSKERPRVAGHSMWHYLTSEYGESSITTLLYLMRLRSDFDENIEFVFGFSLDHLKKSWYSYYSAMFDQEEKIYNEFPTQKLSRGFKAYFPVSRLSLSPDGKTLAYVENENGRYDVWLLDIETQEREKIFSFGSKNKVQQEDYNYPIVSWHPDKPEITLVYEKQDKIIIRRQDLYLGEVVEQDIPEDIGRIFSIDYINSEEYLISALIDGFSDLIVYGTKYRGYEKITNDFYDDINASYVEIGNQFGALFSSNRSSQEILPERLDTILPLANFDVFFIPLDGDYALNLTNSPNQSELEPRLVSGTYLSFLESSTGVNNRWVVDLSSRRKAFQSSNVSRNIISHDAVAASGIYAYQCYIKGKYEVFIESPIWRRTAIAGNDTESQSNTVLSGSSPTNSDLDDLPDMLLFNSEFPDPAIIENLESNPRLRIRNRNYLQENNSTNGDVIKFIPALAVASRRQFKLEEFSAKADNEVLFEGLESYTDERQELEATPTGLLIKGVVKDMFEDFALELGVRIPFDFNGSEFYALYDDKRKRIDRRIAVYRRQFTDNQLLNNVLQKQKSTTFLGLHRLSYPFDTYRSVRVTGQLRFDKQYLLNTDISSSAERQYNEQRISLKLEYIFDNSLQVDLNLRHGTQFKAYVESINRFRLVPGEKTDFSLGLTHIIGLDGRHHVPVLRNSVLALRIAAASSYGSDKMLYYVGGTDGWVTPSFDQEIPIPPNKNFAFKALAPNLRGFNHNIRNGQSFLVSSAEIRVPIFKYLSKRELKSKFLRNIQLQAFFDIGSAWHGLWPSVSNSPINTVTIDDTPGVIVTLDLDRSVFVYGYGVGARINLLGYFLRADYAWGVESGIKGEPKLYFSLGTDF